jgi:hypothetical protein
MASFREYRRRAILPFIGMGLAAYYLLVFLPLSKRAEDSAQLNKSWRELTASVGRTNAMALDFGHIHGQLEETRHALAALAKAESKTVARLQASADLRAQISSPFRLVDYQNEVSRHTDEVSREAALHKIQVSPVVYDGLPQHRVDITEPALLWAALRMAEDVMDTALACRVKAIYYLDMPITFTNMLSTETSKWAEMSLTIEFVSSAPAAAKFLQSLPLRAEEIKQAGLPETSPEKSVVFIDRLLVKRQTPEESDEVRVWLRAAGFVMRE